VAGVVPADAGVVAEGRAVPVGFAEVALTAGGRVSAVPVKEGAIVAAGDVLLQLDDAAAALAVQSAQASADGATAQSCATHRMMIHGHPPCAPLWVPNRQRPGSSPGPHVERARALPSAAEGRGKRGAQ
jgi:multidrug efflux pump subunit AcrA (membrane-fusion protein)